MMTARAIGLQGIGYGPRLVAVQGFAPVPVLGRVYGGGGRYTDEDIERLVREKWEAIESERQVAPDPVQKTAVSPTRPAPRVEEAAEIEQVAPILAMPGLSSAVARSAPAPLLPDAAERAREARRRNDEDALILMLSELL